MYPKFQISSAFLKFLGLAIGNGLSDPENQLLYSSYLYQLGLIDDAGRTQFEDAEKVTKEHIEKYKTTQLRIISSILRRHRILVLIL